MLADIEASDSDTPFADKLAQVWFDDNPASKPTCCQCGKQFPIIGPAGVPSMVCPFCGFVPSERICEGAVREWAKYHAEPAPAAAETEAPPDARLDPPGLDDVIGNAAAVLQISTALDAHRARLAEVDGRTGAAKSLVFPHLLLAGVGGTGKTMLAEIIAREVKRPIRLQMGQSLNSPSRVTDMLQTLRAGDILFVDELHGMKGPAQEALYRAMEDGIVVPVTRGKAVSVPVKLPPFTLIGSTTDEWALLPSLTQRFKYRVRLERMTAPELSQALLQRAGRKGWQLTPDAALMIAERAHGTPRLAIGLLDGCLDTAMAGGEHGVDAMIVQATCDIWQLDGLGLDATARKYLAHLREAGGNPVRLNVLAAKLDGLSRTTIERRIEPDLVFLGLIEKQANGRTLTGAGRDYTKGGN